MASLYNCIYLFVWLRFWHALSYFFPVELFPGFSCSTYVHSVLITCPCVLVCVICMCKPTLCVHTCRNVCTCMKASKLVPQWTRQSTASTLTWSLHFYLCVPGSLTLMSTDPPVSASCLASGALSEVTDVCCCAHPYSGFWKASWVPHTRSKLLGPLFST